MKGKQHPGRRPLLAKALATRLALPGFGPEQVSASDFKRALAALPASRRAVFAYLAAHARQGVACPSQLRIAKALQLHKDTVKKAIRALRRIGAITATEYDTSVPLKTIAAYAIFVLPRPPSNSGYKLPRKRYPRTVAVNFNKQRITTDPAASDALAALQRVGVPTWAALRDVRRIGGAIVLRRLTQMRDRPAFVRGEIANPAGYARRCIANDFPEPPPRWKSLAPQADRDRRKEWALIYQRENRHKAEKEASAIGAMKFRDEFMRRFRQGTIGGAS